MPTKAEPGSLASPGVAHLRGNYKHVLTEHYYYTRTRPTSARARTNGVERVRQTERKRASEREAERVKGGRERMRIRARVSLGLTRVYGILQLYALESSVGNNKPKRITIIPKSKERRRLVSRVIVTILSRSLCVTVSIGQVVQFKGSEVIRILVNTR